MNLMPKGMTEMQEHKDFWDKNAGQYDRFMRKDRAAYDEMYALSGHLCGIKRCWSLLPARD